VRSLVERGALGEKSGRGFYRRDASAGASTILTLDPATLEYRPRREPQLPALEGARSVEHPAERMKRLFLGRDRVGDFLRRTLGSTLVYTARVAPDIAHSIDDVDRAMKWGFGWDMGPFEIWDAIGVREVVDAVHEPAPPPLVAGVLGSGQNRFRPGDLPPAAPDLLILKSAKDRNRILRRNPAASLVDLDDGVLAVEFHSKLNTIGSDTIQMLNAGVAEAAANFSALVVGSEAPQFSAGANLMLVLLEAQEGNWDEIDLMVRSFQAATLGLRLAPVPVVVAAGGLALGGGCEIALHGAAVQAAAELYMGLVEVGVGLIPAGGGTKEMLARSSELVAVPGADALPFVQRAFETIGFAKTSTSAPDARRLGFLRPVDAITMNRDRLVSDAKQAALQLARSGYRPPAPREIAVGGATLLAALKLGVHLAWRAGRISDHDALIGRTLAFVMAGGSLPHATTVSEPYLLDLEREAFLKLCGEPRTLDRIRYTLKTGKTLRN
jgi:3-hydroxyacyl-CoA dehydrogenase